MYSAAGLGHSIVQLVAESSNNARAIVIDEDGEVTETQTFWARERAAQQLRFGKLTPALFERQAPLSDSDSLTVDIMVLTDLPEPERPYDGTDVVTPIEEFEAWSRAHANAQVARIATSKARVLDLLGSNDGVVIQNPRGLPTIRAVVSLELLRSQELNAPDVVRIDEVIEAPAELLSYAGRSSMAASPSAGGLTGGLCGTACDGVSLDVGLWERDSSTLAVYGIARQNGRVSSNTVTGYFECPTACSTDANCPNNAPGLKISCRTQSNSTRICVQDHLTWSTASVGMNGDYAYDTFLPGGADPVANTAGQSFSSTGAWNTDKRVGNNNGAAGLDFLIAPPTAGSACSIANAPPSIFINRSVSQTPVVADFPGRAFGTFMTVSSGNSNSGPVTCGSFRNGLCVGAFDYRTFDNQDTHRRMVIAGDAGSSFVNPTSLPGLERPHLLGPGSHQFNTSGLHLPDIEVDALPPMAGPPSMRHADYTPPPNGPAVIAGTSFAAPTVLSVAIQALHFEGLFSSLVFPMVNKAILMAATRDANADGAVGKSTSWSSTPDSEDGGGQINFGFLSSILSNNTYHFTNLADANFVSCGTGCRKYTVTTLTVQAARRVRAALAWQSCMTSEGSTPVLNNDLDLVLSCTGTVCPGVLQSNTAVSELEMLERQVCVGAPKAATATCSLEVRIKNGAPLLPCGSTTTERIGVAWRLQ